MKLLLTAVAMSIFLFPLSALADDSHLDMQ
jgi:hypothetical protein